MPVNRTYTIRSQPSTGCGLVGCAFVIVCMLIPLGILALIIKELFL